jgi:hypothetical protein
MAGLTVLAQSVNWLGKGSIARKKKEVIKHIEEVIPYIL